MQRSRSYEIICSYMPEDLRRAMQKVPSDLLSDITEVRLRINRPVSYISAGAAKYLSKNGSLLLIPDELSCIIPGRQEIDRIFAALCRFSVHSCSRQLSEGYFSLSNGIRVGIAGTYSSDSAGTIKYVSSLNFRIARQIHGCASRIYDSLFSSGARSVLICGGVNSGKTTLLRDLCRLCSSRYKISLIDERGELAASVNGIPANDIGIQTDILDGCRRCDGIITSVRSLSPQMIFTDEISTEADAEAILSACGTGVKFAATIHAASLEELNSRRISRLLLDAGVFDCAVILTGESMPGRIREIRRLTLNA